MYLLNVPACVDRSRTIVLAMGSADRALARRDSRIFSASAGSLRTKNKLRLERCSLTKLYPVSEGRDPIAFMRLN